MAIKRPPVAPPAVTKTVWCADCQADTSHQVSQDANGELIAVCQNQKVRDVELAGRGILVGRDLLPLEPEVLGDLISKTDDADVVNFLNEKRPGWDQPKACGHFIKIPKATDLDEHLRTHKSSNAVS